MTLQKLVVFELAPPEANCVRGRLWGGFGRLWEALGMLWEALGGALGGFGDSFRPPPNKKNNYIQKCWEYANFQ